MYQFFRSILRSCLRLCVSDLANAQSNYVVECRINFMYQILIRSNAQSKLHHYLPISGSGCVNILVEVDHWISYPLPWCWCEPSVIAYQIRVNKLTSMSLDQMWCYVTQSVCILLSISHSGFIITTHLQPHPIHLSSSWILSSTLLVIIVMHQNTWSKSLFKNFQLRWLLF